MKAIILKAIRIACLLLPLGFLVLYLNKINTPSSCTIITASKGEEVFFGNNEDSHFEELLLGFRTANVNGYGSILVGFRHPDGQIEFGGAMNEKGLAWDVNSTPNANLNPNPEKPLHYFDDNYLGMITRKAATVEEVIRLTNLFNFGDSMNVQYHFADSSGDAVVISAGKDGELAFTRKHPGASFLVSTNFNLDLVDEVKHDWRFKTANEYLNDMMAKDSFNAQSISNIMEAVRLRTLTSFTMYTNIFNLNDQTITIYYKSQYGEMVELDLQEELAKGDRIENLDSFFSKETVNAGDKDYQSFANRFLASKIIVITIGILSFIGISFVLLKFLQQKRIKF